MDQKEIRKLLARYYEGATSEAEESILLNYLSGLNVPEEFAVDKELFMIRDMEVPEPGKDFDRKLLSVTMANNKKEVFRSRRMIWYYSVAAGIMLLIAGYMGKDYLTLKPSYMNDTFSDPELAMAEVRRVLGKVSGNMTKGTESLSDIRAMGIAPATISTFTRAAQTASKSIDMLRDAAENSLPSDGNNNIEKQ